MSVSLSQRLMVRKRGEEAGSSDGSEAARVRERIIRRAALEFKDGMYGILTSFSHTLQCCNL